MNQQEKLTNEVMDMVKEQTRQIVRVAQLVDQVAGLLVDVSKLVAEVSAIARTQKTSSEKK